MRYFEEGSEEILDVSTLSNEEEMELERNPDYVAEKLALQLMEEAVRLMEEKGLSRTQLAQGMGVSRAYVTRLLDAPPSLTLRSIARLALTLGTRPHVSLFSHCSVPASSTQELSHCQRIT